MEISNEIPYFVQLIHTNKNVKKENSIPQNFVSYQKNFMQLKYCIKLNLKNFKNPAGR
jgi:ABC-type uncharacterized transport system substrate-binding protein